MSCSCNRLLDNTRRGGFVKALTPCESAFGAVRLLAITSRIRADALLAAARIESVGSILCWTWSKLNTFWYVTYVTASL